MNCKKKMNQEKLGRGKLGQGKLGQGKLGQGKLGFSLLELSFVIIITSILIMAVAKGNQILKRARIVAAQSLTKSSPIPRIPNLIVWYETTMDNSFSDTDIASTNINTWYNLNPAIKTNNAVIGNAPTYTKNAINNLPALQFNGSANYLTFDGTSLANSDYTVIVVEERLSTCSSSFCYFISGNGSSATDQVLQLGYRSNTQITFDQFNDGYNITIGGYSTPTPLIHTFRFSSTLGKNYYLNGVNQTLIPGGSPTATQGLVSYVSAQIGKYQTTNYYQGNIGEIIIFNKYINDDEMNDIKLYLSKKWNITVS